jgi:hypothetical protein
VIPRTATLITILHATGHRLGVEPIGPAVDREATRRQLAMSVPRLTRQAPGPIRILRRLRRFNVPFVLIGELAEVAHGSPVKIGRAIVVCIAETDVARLRLAQTLDDLGEAASADHLSVLTHTVAGDDYDVLLRNAVNILVDNGLLVRVAALEDLIRIRRESRAPEDVAAAAELDAIAGISLTS